MIDFSKYLGKPIVLSTKYFDSEEDVSGIRSKSSTLIVLKFKGRFVAARPLTKDDLKDEDFLQWMQSMWNSDTTKILTFIKWSKPIHATQEKR